jgi:hypothetical protein
MQENDEMLDSGMAISPLKKNHKVRDNSKRAKTAQILIWLVIIAESISIISSYFQYDMLSKIKGFQFISDSEANANDLREQAVGAVYLVIYIISGITFIQWFRRAYYNLMQRTNCNTTDGWAAGGWFVPIMNWFKPYQMMNELWTKTGALLKKNDVSTSILGIWWTLWIVTSIASNAVNRIALRANDVDTFIYTTLADIAISIVHIPAGYIAIMIIKKYNTMEEELLNLENQNNEFVEI